MARREKYPRFADRAGRTVCHLPRKTGKGMAWRQRHVVHLSHIPSTDDVPTAVRVRTNAFDQCFNLVNRAAIRPRPGTPLRPVYRAKLSMFVRPLIPNMHIMICQIRDVGRTGKEPQKLRE